MKYTLVIHCPHVPRTHRLVFACEITGDYVLELCKKCRAKESDEFLIEEKQA